MKFGLFFIGALFIGAFGAHFLMEDAGLVSISFRGYIVEMSVPILALFAVAAYALVRILVYVLRAPRSIGRAAAQIRQKRARENLTRGLLEISEGNLARGEKLLARTAHRSDEPMLNYLGAARAAQRQGANERRDTWLKLAYEENPDASAAVLLTKAELQIEEEQFEHALATLRELDKISPKHGQALALMARVYKELGDWASLRELLPRLRRAGTLTAGAIDKLDLRSQREMLVAAGAGGNVEEVRALWRGLPRKLQSDPNVFLAYVRALRDVGEHRAAEEAIRKSLGSAWSDELVLLYGELEDVDAAAVLKRVENWLRTRGDDPGLLLTAARISMRNELWGKARSYLESSLALGPRVDAYQTYGRLLEHLGETDAAAESFRAGLALATGNRVSGLPALSAPAIPDKLSPGSKAARET